MLNTILKIQAIAVLCFVLLFMSQCTYDNADQMYAKVKTEYAEIKEEMEDTMKKVKKALDKWFFKV